MPSFSSLTTPLARAPATRPTLQDMYPRILRFAPAVRAQLEMSVARPNICPLVVARGAGDAGELTTRFEQRDDPAGACAVGGG